MRHWHRFSFHEFHTLFLKALTDSKDNNYCIQPLQNSLQFKKHNIMLKTGRKFYLPFISK